MEISWYMVKTNKSGAPAHPLYQKDDADLKLFNPSELINEKIPEFYTKLEKKKKKIK